VRRSSLAIGCLALVVAALCVGCGDDGEGERGGGGGGRTTGAPQIERRVPTPAETRAIESTITRLERAIGEGDAREVCGLYTEDTRQTQAAAYTSCDAATRSDLEGKEPPRLGVGRIEVSSARGQPGVLEASAAVTSSADGRDPFELEAVLVREGPTWHVDGGVLDYLLAPDEE
jgi:hypothetical protein